MAKKSLRDIEINKELFQSIWKKLNETTVEDVFRQLKQNKKLTLIILVSIIVLLGAGLLIKFNLNVLDAKDQEQTQENALPSELDTKLPVTTFLPQTKRTDDAKPELKDPFAGKVLLKGIITGGGGNNLAIIEVGNTSFIAGPGDELTGGLEVAEVREEQVILTKGDQKITLDMSGRNKTEISKPPTENGQGQNSPASGPTSEPAPTQGVSDSAKPD